MSRAEQPSRRTVLAAAVAAAVVSAAGPAVADTAGAPAEATDTDRAPTSSVDNHAWTTYADWRRGAARGTRAVPGSRPGLEIGAALGSVDYTDPHTGKTAAWEYATWTSPVHRLSVPATETIASWNAHTPASTPGSRSSCAARTPTARTPPGT